MHDMKDIFIADIRSNCSYKGLSTGHYIPVARMYKKLFAEIANVIVAGGPVYCHYFQKDELLILPHNVCGDSFKHKLLTFQNCKRLFKEAKGKIIILQQSSDITCHIALSLFYHGGSKLYMIRYSKAGINTPFKKLIYELCKRKVDGIICPNNEVGKAYGRPYCIVPDYIYINQQDTKNIFSTYEEKKYDFCIIGRISQEKGVVEVAKKFVNTEYKVIIAGKTQTKDLELELQEICSNANNIELRIGYISDEDYLFILQHSRYTILNYQGEYALRSSGVVYDTLFSGVPVIGCRCNALKFAEDAGCGYLYDSLEDFSPRDVLNPTLYKEYIHNIEMYRKSHSTFHNKLITFINSSL